MTSKTYQVALLGAGYIAEWHCQALRSVPGTRIAAVCDQQAGRAEALARKFGIPAVAKDIDDLLATCRPDAVHVLVPAELHAPVVGQLLRAGVPTLVEKPLCPTAAECRELAGQSRETGAPLGVSHNFLFDEAYERLRADVRAGVLGRLDQVTITWNRPFPRLRTGPSGWVLRDPAHPLLEIGPHAIAQLVDLVGVPDRIEAEADRETELASGVVMPRRWLARARVGATVVDLKWSFEAGYDECRIDLRGAAGAATVDLNRSTYVLRRPGGSGQDDLERFRDTVGEGAALVCRGIRVFARYAATRCKLAKKGGNPFCSSIARVQRAFYEGLGRPIDSRLSADFAADVMTVCAQIARSASPEKPVRPAIPREPRPVAPLAAGPEEAGRVLVLGGTGFIGQPLIRHLVQAGRRVRLLTRDTEWLPKSLRSLPLEIVRGNLAAPADLDAAFIGVRDVIHLARGEGKTWEDYLRTDVQPTLAVAEACLKHGVRRLIYTGTIDSLYTAERGGVIDDDTPLDRRIHRRNLYARAKAESEGCLLDLHATRGLPVVIARPGVVIGPGASPFHWGTGYWPAMFVCRLWGEGVTPLPLVLVEDVASALVRMLSAPEIEGQTFNLVAGSDVTARDYLTALERATGTKVDARAKPAWRHFAEDLTKYAVKVLVRHPGRRAPSYRDWNTRSHRARFDCSKARRVLGWEPVADRTDLIRRGVEEAAKTWFA